MFIIRLCAILIFPIIAHADDGDDSAVIISKIENYLNSIESIQASFQQYTPGEVYSSGMFYFEQPRKFLWQYHLPNEQKVVSDGSRVFFHDPDTEQTTQLPPKAGFANFLNQKPMTLKGEGFTVDNVKSFDGVIELDVKIEGEEGNVFNLKFAEKPVKLLSMSQKGEFGNGVAIVFANHRMNKDIDDKFFKFKPELEQIPE